MKKNTTLLLAIIVLFSAIGFVVWKVRVEGEVVPFVPAHWSVLNVEKSYRVTHIDVLKGHEFDLKLEDGRRIAASLEVSTAKEATEKVIRFLNSCTNPRCVLKHKMIDTSMWNVVLFVTDSEGREINLADWLLEQGLVFQGSLI